jgi:hypothetical protein
MTSANNELNKAITFLADCCDGASSLDNAGFNKADSFSGKRIAAKIQAGHGLTESEVAKAIKFCVKYQRQLAFCDLELIKTATVDKSIKLAPKPVKAAPSQEELLEIRFVRETSTLEFEYVKGVEVEAVNDTNREMMRRLWATAIKVGVPCLVF